MVNLELSDALFSHFVGGSIARVNRTSGLINSWPGDVRVVLYITEKNGVLYGSNVN